MSLSFAKPSLRRTLIVGAAALFVVLAGVTYWSYGIFVKQWESGPVRTIALWTHFPAARVGWRVVTYADYLNQLDAERRFLSGPSAKAQGFPPEPTTQMRKDNLERAVRIAAVEDLAARNKFKITSADIEAAYTGLVARAGTSTTPEEIKSFLMDQFGWEVSDFKLFVIRPALMEDGLRQKFLASSSTAPLDQQLQDRMDSNDVKRYLKF